MLRRSWAASVLPVVAVFAAGVGAMSGWALAQAPDKLKIAIGQRGNWDTSVPELGQRAGIFKKHGLELELLYAAGGGETLQAVISGSTDLGTSVGILSVLGTYQKGAPLRIVSAQATGARELFFYVKGDSPIKSLKDTDGKSVAYSANGSSTHGILLALVKQMDLKSKLVAGGGQPGVLTGVMSGQIDVGYAVPPFGLAQLDKGEIREIATGFDAVVFRDQTIRVNVANLTTMTTKKPLLDRFMTAYRETVDFMYADPAIMKLYGEFVGTTPEIAGRVRDKYFPKEMLNPDRIQGLEVIMKDAVESKFLTGPLNEGQLKELMQIVPR